MSSEDIPKGSRWSQEVGSQLEGTSAGVIVIVPGNAREPWVNFEAGALSKSIADSLVSPFLFGVTPAELPATLAQFQATRYEREDVWRLVKSLNDGLAQARVPQDRLKRTFELCWPGLEKALAPIEASLKAVREEEYENEEPQEKQVVSFSEEAVRMLTAAAADESGILIKSGSMGGTEISANKGDTFLEPGSSRREEARWESALQELERYGLIEDKKGLGEIFFLTKAGYDAADQVAEELKETGEPESSIQQTANAAAET
jgi:hypothetical protein